MMRLFAAALALSYAAAAPAAEPLTLATWNMEWMMTPQIFDALAPACFGGNARAGGNERAIPCDLVPKGRWSAADLARIRDFAASLPADVIALQEIDGRDVAEKLFPGHGFCFTKRRAVQNVGFAVRRESAFRCNATSRRSACRTNDVRWGADLTLEPGTPREMRLLAVHLKSSCNRDPLTSERYECRLLQRQVPVLEDWIDGAREGGQRLRRHRRLQPPLRSRARDRAGRKWRDRRDVARDRRR